MLKLKFVLFVTTLVLVAGLVSVGCSGQNAAPPASGSLSADDWKTGLDDDVVEALSELPDADRTAALAQKVCPVSDKPLGSMGKPPKVTVEGQEVFLCCDGCEEEIKSNPADYLSKLNGN